MDAAVCNAFLNGWRNEPSCNPILIPGTFDKILPMIRIDCHCYIARWLCHVRGFIVVFVGITSMTWSSDPCLAEKERVFEATFGRQEDRNRDGWPDAWRRITDRDHPRFVAMKLSSRSEATEEQIQLYRKSLAQWMLAFRLKKLPGQIIAESIPEEIDTFLERSIKNPYLEVQMNGGAALIEGPDFAIDPKNAYRLQLEMAASMTDPFVVQAHMVWMDSKKKELAIQSSQS